MLYAAVALYLAVAAVVVGQKQSLGRHQFTRTATPKEHNGIFQSGLIDAVNILGRKLKTLGSHIVNALANQTGEPHTLVGNGHRQCCT